MNKRTTTHIASAAAAAATPPPLYTDVLLLIYRHLDVNETIAAGRVCNAWHAATRAEQQIKQCTFRCACSCMLDGLLDSSYAKHVQSFIGLKKMELRLVENIPLLAQLKELTSVDITVSSCVPSSPGVEPFRSD